MVSFNVQQALVDMEDRLTIQLGSLEVKLNNLDAKADGAALTAEVHNGRISRLEEKMGWAEKGLATLLVGFCTFIWAWVKARLA